MHQPEAQPAYSPRNSDLQAVLTCFSTSEVAVLKSRRGLESVIVREGKAIEVAEAAKRSKARTRRQAKRLWSSLLGWLRLQVITSTSVRSARADSERAEHAMAEVEAAVTRLAREADDEATQMQCRAKALRRTASHAFRRTLEADLAEEDDCDPDWNGAYAKKVDFHDEHD